MSHRFVNLANAHFFYDLTPIPKRLHKAFDIEVFDDMTADGDWAVSDAIQQLGVWEPVETALMSSAFAGHHADTQFLDFGAHIGWYSVIARAWGLPVEAWDASEQCCQMMNRRLDTNLRTHHIWIEEGWKYDTPPWSPLIVKMDVEGAEVHVVKGLAQHFHAHTIQQALIEMSPVFPEARPTYPYIADALINLGYECWVLPGKQDPPPELGDPRLFLELSCRGLHFLSETQRTSWINRQHQFNAMFCLPEARWG